MRTIYCLISLALTIGCPIPGWPLDANEILVIANHNAANSVSLALYYMQRRNIPESNLLLIWVTDKEICSREAYDTQVVQKVRKFLKEKDPYLKIRCLMTIYGVPLKIQPPALSRHEQEKLQELRDKQKTLQEKVKTADENSPEIRKSLESAIAELKAHQADL